MIDSVTIGNIQYTEIVKFLNEKRRINPNYSIIDVGGSTVGWSNHIVNAIVDINPPEKENPLLKFYQVNMNIPDDWETLLHDVNKNGKYDFSICTHTLEDIGNPLFVCQMLSKISKRGYIAVPTKYRELSRFEWRTEHHPGYRGYIHHRWIFTIRDQQFFGFPKIGYLDADPYFDKFADISESLAEFRFFWRDEIKLHLVNNGYLGPNPAAVVGYYRQLLADDDLENKRSN